MSSKASDLPLGAALIAAFCALAIALAAPSSASSVDERSGGDFSGEVGVKMYDCEEFALGVVLNPPSSCATDTSIVYMTAAEAESSAPLTGEAFLDNIDDAKPAKEWRCKKAICPIGTPRGCNQAHFYSTLGGVGPSVDAVPAPGGGFYARTCFDILLREEGCRRCEAIEA
jgi:hypothetical protein